MSEGCLVLTLSTSDIYNVAKKKICGFEWQAEAMVDEEFLDIFLWCNREVEGNLWRCNARVTIIALGVNGASDAVRKQVTTFHTSNRSMKYTIRNELSMGDIEIRLELYDISGYRDYSMFTIDFTKPSPLTDLCIGFQDSDVRVYVNTQYLSIHSAKFAHLFVRIKPGCAEKPFPTTENKSEFGTCSDYDVLSMKSEGETVKLDSDEEMFRARTQDVDNMCFLLPSDDAAGSSPATGLEGNVLILKDVGPGEFLVLLKAIYPPFAAITKENLQPLLAMSFRFGVEHMLWKGERYLMTKEAQQSFDVFERLEFATLFNMAALQSDCLSKLLTANDVRQVLDDPRIECAPKQVRSVLLEALLQRFRADSVTQEGNESAAVAKGHVCNLFKSVRAAKETIAPLSAEVKVEQKSTDIAEIASLREELKKQEAIRMNLEMSLKDLVFDAFNACELSKEQNITPVGYSARRFSTHEIFVDLVLPPFISMNSIIYSFLNHLFVKMYGKQVIPVVRSHLLHKIDAFPPGLADIVASAIISGYKLDEQLENDELLILELRTYLQKRLQADFNVYCDNMKAGYLMNSLP
ncbi:hypothetical protein NECAME_07124 [Necator americanus]|uniref:BTB domain-containing protein n=1 Tax=Necator americanus TaxID=51031 RepID=W2TPG1_NECAM|nr:hypothetical protein NECAME_07124 [Necator americanus]ETN83970.1 hypothetical protein NECAME_07124 [Necator americanus]